MSSDSKTFGPFLTPVDVDFSCFLVEDKQHQNLSYKNLSIKVLQIEKIFLISVAHKIWLEVILSYPWTFGYSSCPLGCFIFNFATQKKYEQFQTFVKTKHREREKKGSFSFNRRIRGVMRTNKKKWSRPLPRHQTWFVMRSDGIYILWDLNVCGLTYIVPKSS